MQARVLALLPLVVLAALPAQAATGDAHAQRWVEGDLQLDSPDVQRTLLTGTFLLRRETFDGRSYTASDMAQAYRADPRGFLDSVTSEVNASFAARLEELFPTAARAVERVEVDAASLQAARSGAYDPPVRVTVAASVVRSNLDLGLGDVTDEQMAAALQAGAVVASAATLRAQPGYAMTYTLHAPQSPRPLVFASAPGGYRSADAKSVTFNLDNVEGSIDLVQTVPLKLKDADVDAPTREDAAIRVLVDLEEVDVTAGRALGGDLGTLHANLVVDADLRAIRVPEDVRAKLGDRAELPFVSSDGIRLALESGLLDRADIDALERSLLDALSLGLSASLGAPIAVTGGLDDATLSSALVSSPASSRVPITFHAEAAFTMTLNAAVSPSAAVAVYSIPQSFSFPRVRDLDTTYTVILPKGLFVQDLRAEGGQASTSATDGRESFTVTPTGASAQATMSIAVAPSFVVAKFWPILLLVVLAAVLLVGTPIALLVLRRRKARAAQ